jgi:hypothetical protein
MDSSHSIRQIATFAKQVKDTIAFLVFLPVVTLTVAILFFFMLLPDQSVEAYLTYLDPEPNWYLFVRSYVCFVALSLMMYLYSLELWYAYRTGEPEHRLSLIRFNATSRFLFAILPAEIIAFKAAYHIAFLTPEARCFRDLTVPLWPFLVALVCASFLFAYGLNHPRSRWTRSTILFVSALVPLVIVIAAVSWIVFVPGASCLASFYSVTKWLWVGLGTIAILLAAITYAQDRVTQLRSRMQAVEVCQTLLMHAVLPGYWLAVFLFLLYQAWSLRLDDMGVDSFFVLLNFLSCLIVLLSAFALWTGRNRAAALAFVVSWGVALSAFDLNDHYRIGSEFADSTDRPVALAADPLPRIPRVELQFHDWLGSRTDLVKYLEAQSTYPVFIVAAQGGGIYAAYQTALALARIQDRNTFFAERVLAISGVSGGALGAAVFVAAVEATKEAAGRPHECKALRARNLSFLQDAGPVERIVQCFFRHDLLATVLATGLYSDMAAFLIPRGLWPEGADRGSALARTIDKAWRTETSKLAPSTATFFRRRVGESWSPCLHFPALVTNTTVVERGSLAVIAPFAWGGMLAEDLTLKSVDHIAYFDPALDLTLAGAVSLSARFPWVLPAGTISLPVRQKLDIQRGAGLEGKIHIVDGGYFENSGTVAATALIASLRNVAKKKSASDEQIVRFSVEPPKCASHGMQKTDTLGLPAWWQQKIGSDSGAKPVEVSVRFHLISFAHQSSDYLDGRAASEFLAPFRTMLNARAERNTTAIRFETTNKGYTYFLGDEDFYPPLGLALSESSLREIEARSGFVGTDVSLATIRNRSAADTMRRNNNTARDILVTLGSIGAR